MNKYEKLQFSFKISSVCRLKDNNLWHSEKCSKSFINVLRKQTEVSSKNLYKKLFYVKLKIWFYLYFTWIFEYL